MSCEPLGSALPLFSTAKSSRARSAGGRSGNLPFQIRIAILRVLLPMPERSIGRKFGSICTTTMEPGGLGLCREANGWSIQPPASCRRLGMAPRSLAIGVVFCINLMGELSRRGHRRQQRWLEVAAGEAQRAGEVAQFLAGQFHNQSVRRLLELQFSGAAKQFDFPDFVLRRVRGLGEGSDR